MDRIVRRPRLALVGTGALLALVLMAFFVAFRTTAQPGAATPATGDTPQWDRHILVNGTVIEVQKGRLYRIIQAGWTPTRTLTADQKRRLGELTKRLGALRAADPEGNKEEIYRLLVEISTNPEFDVGGGWRGDGYYWFPLYEGQPQPPGSEAIVLDFTAPNGPEPNPAWRYAQ